jgi:hypothetical protein
MAGAHWDVNNKRKTPFKKIKYDFTIHMVYSHTKRCLGVLFVFSLA